MRQRDFEAIVAGLSAQGMTKTEIARRAHISRDTLWRILAGMSRRPSHEVVTRIEALAKAAGVSRKGP